MRTRYFSTLSVTLFILCVASQLIAGPAIPAPDTPGSGSLTGTVKFQGTAPKGTRIDMSSDPNCEKAHSTPATTEEYVVGPGGGLENVIVYVSDGLAGKTFDTPTQAVDFEQKGCTYKPHIVALQANQKLNVINSDNTTHNIHPSPNNNREWNRTQPHGVALEETFAREEIPILVKCNIHPWMKGYIAVFKHPYFAVTDNNGSFNIKGLPPGTYTITVWHEKLGTMTQKVTVSATEPGKMEFVFKQ